MKQWAPFLILFLSLHMLSFSQVRLSASDRADISLITDKLAIDKQQVSNPILGYLPINYIGSDYYLSFVGKINKNFDRRFFEERSILVGNPIASIVSLKIKVSDLASIDAIQGIDHLKIACIDSKLHSKSFRLHFLSCFQYTNLKCYCQHNHYHIFL